MKNEMGGTVNLTLSRTQVFQLGSLLARMKLSIPDIDSELAELSTKEKNQAYDTLEEIKQDILNEMISQCGISADLFCSPSVYNKGYKL